MLECAGSDTAAKPMERVEDAALLTASAKFTDDMPMQAGTLHVAFLRSPHASADILSIDISAAESRAGVAARQPGTTDPSVP